MTDKMYLSDEITTDLKKAFFRQLKTVKVSDSDWLAKAVAVERVLGDESCLMVAWEQGYSNDPFEDEFEEDPFVEDLMKIAVNGLAGVRVLNGEPCNLVANYHGIREEEALDALELLAVKGVAGRRVRNGEPCDKVAHEHGMSLEDPGMDELELIAVEGFAGQRVRDGESPTSIALQYGIAANSVAMKELEEIASSRPVAAKRPRVDLKLG